MPSGGCLCGSLKYTYTNDPVGKALCHCNECKKLTGSAFGYYLLVPRQSFQFTSGLPKVFSFKHKTGYEVRISFCADCGTRIYKEFDREQEKDFFLVLAGSLDEADMVGQKPDLEIWIAEKVGWLPAVAEAGQFSQFT